MNLGLFIYLMIENTMITPNQLTLKTLSKKDYKENPYRFYYIFERYTDGVVLLKKYEKEFDSLMSLAKLDVYEVKKTNKKDKLYKIFGISNIPTYKEIVTEMMQIIKIE